MQCFQQVPSAAGPALQGRSEGCGVLQVVKMMATFTKMQNVHGFHRTCSVHELEELEFYFYFLVLLLLVCLSLAVWKYAFFFSLLCSMG